MKEIREPSRLTPVLAETDVLVVGSGPGGLAAAVSSARAGVATLLVERYGCLGGNLTHVGVEGIAWYRQEKTVDVEGIGIEFEQRAKTFGAICRRAAALECELEAMEGRMSTGQPIEIELYGRLASRLCRLFEIIGIKRLARPIDPLSDVAKALEAYPAKAIDDDGDGDGDGDDNEPANRILQERIAHLLTRPIGRPPNTGSPSPY
jgi:glycine/D-amino acid oxidase-like deaminating enzyme